MIELNTELYARMYLIRTAEQKIRQHYSEDEMKTPMHMSTGEEAIAVGVCHALRAEDQVFGTYRSHATYLAKTENVEDFFFELYGKDPALLKGKGGSMHMCAPECGFMGTSAIVASIIPVAVGAAFANKRQGNGKVATVFFGDGALEEGDFWEALNTASLMKLPVLFVCEDNGLAVHSPTSKRQGFGSITDIVSQFRCSVLKSDSTDVEVIYNLTLKAVDLVKTGDLPCFMNLKYYRYLEHVGVNEDFDAGYRSRDEYEEWLKRDPLVLQRRKLLALSVPEERLAAIEKAIYERVANSQRLAKAAPVPDGEELCQGVYA